MNSQTYQTTSEAYHQFRTVALPEAMSVLRPPPKLTVAEWADAKRRLSPESSAEPGQWHTDRAEYQRGMMEAGSDPRVESIAIKTSARVGKTETLNNILGYYIDQDPAPIMMVQPTVDDGQKWSKDQFAPMVRDCPVLAAKVAPDKVRNSSSTILHKSFVGGYLTVVGSNAPTGLRRSTIRILLMDEIDAYPPSAGVEGDPIALARKRTVTFWNRKIIMTSTPTIEGLSRIDIAFSESDQRYFFVPCPNCNHFQILIFGPSSQLANRATGLLKFDEAAASWAFYECENCRQPIEERSKLKIVRAGKWIPTYPERIRTAGFAINELYSPFSSWIQIARDFLEAKQRREMLKVFINTSLGETFRETESYQYSGETLLSRREMYEKVPPGVIFLTAGVDVQDDRLEAYVEGWGIGEENWTIDHYTAYGSPARPETWRLLDDFLGKSYEHENGYIAKPGRLGGLIAVGIDTGGHFTRDVYAYVSRRKGSRVFAIKGLGGFGKPFLKVSKSKKVAVQLVLVGTDAGKQLIMDRLQIDKPGPGYLHFNMKNDESYFDQLTSERKTVKRIKGYPSIVWELIAGRRNEALDAKVYSLAAFTLLGANMEKLAKRFAEKMEAYLKTKETTPAEQPTPDDEKTNKPRRPIVRPKLRRPGFVNRWR